MITTDHSVTSDPFNNFNLKTTHSRTEKKKKMPNFGLFTQKFQKPIFSPHSPYFKQMHSKTLDFENGKKTAKIHLWRIIKRKAKNSNVLDMILTKAAFTRIKKMQNVAKDWS